MLRVLSEEGGIILNYLAEIRDVNIQKDPMRFRRNLERIGECMAYELSKELSFSKADVKTPLGVKETSLLADDIVLGAILRASLPMHQGLLNVFDRAENFFLAAYRVNEPDGGVHTALKYAAGPSLEGKTLILADPMLATGQSMVDCLNLMLKYGKPTEIHILSAISSRSGLNFVKEHIDDSVKIWLADLDEGLNEKFYIVPGLGDAGDLAFGEKLDGE